MASSTVWLLRAVWATLPLVAGPTLAGALDPTSTALRTSASVGLWVIWALTLGALLVPRTTSLTAARVVVPASVVAAAWAALLVEDPGLGETAALGATAVTAALVLAPAVGEAFVNGSSYGDERRLPLRVPAPLLVGPLPLAWVVAVTGAVAGPLLLAAERWLAGGLVTVVGWPLAWFAVRSLHQLARRWVVLVPAGLVLHDHLALVDPVLVPRRMVARLGPAAAGSDALDLTQGASGLALELQAIEPIRLTVAGAGRHRTGTAAEVDRVLVTPTRPGALLAEARAHRIRTVN